MNINVSRVEGPQLTLPDKLESAARESTDGNRDQLEDQVDIPHGASRLTPERVQALLSDSDDKPHFPEPEVFDQNGDGKLDVLDLVQNIKSAKLDEIPTTSDK